MLYTSIIQPRGVENKTHGGPSVEASSLPASADGVLEHFFPWVTQYALPTLGHELKFLLYIIEMET